MANSTPKNNSNAIKMLVGGLVVLAIAFKATETEPVVRKKGSASKVAAVGTTTKKKKDDFTEDDYTAEFASLDTTTPNSFKPIILSKSSRGNLVATSKNGIPPLFAGGDPNWIYTGNMEVDGVPNALLENTSSGEGIFLRPQERWRKLVLREVGRDSVVLEGPNGYVKTVYVLSNTDTEVVTPAPVVTGTVQTLPPAGPGGRIAGNGLSGPIGSTQALIGDPMADGSSNPYEQTGGRRGRRNR